MEPSLNCHNNSVFFREEISTCVAVRAGCVVDACKRVQSIILLPCMMGMSFVLVTLTRLIVSEPEHWVTWSHRTGFNCPFFKGENPIIQGFYLATSFLTHFYLWCKLIWKIGNFFLLLKDFLRKLKDFCIVIYVLWREIWNLFGFDG